MKAVTPVEPAATRETSVAMAAGSAAAVSPDPGGVREG